MKQIQNANTKNVSVVISRTKRNVRIKDLNKVFDDILMQGEDMTRFLSELKVAANTMSNKPIGETLAVVSAPYTMSKWS